ncbi:alpha-humulene 10-hydroxylase-like [Zingiber officinale]|uniref:alpha-humulene 10-hydroxylase-like n=1 Tax=Zingiber officinale TaxID=94328 RepID=UPI001C4D410C|nr:alpha-humulene 10-hydroxylase-like [Zingiber officinale]
MEVAFSSVTLLLSFLVAIFFFFILRLRRKGVDDDAPLPTGPRAYPLIGNLHLVARGVPHQTLAELVREHAKGPLMRLRLGQVDCFVAANREAAQEIAKHQDLNFAYRPKMTFGQFFAYGNRNVALSPYGDYWKQMRKIYAMEMMSPSRVKSFFSIREVEYRTLVRDISVAGASGQAPVNVSSMLISTGSTIVVKCAFGNKGEKLQRQFLSLVKETLSLITSFAVADMFPSIRFMDSLTGLTYRLGRVHQKLDRMFNEIIALHEADVEDEKKDLIDVLLQLRDQGEDITLESIKAVILEVFLAGSETTSTTIEWAMSEMIRKPETLERAQEEVRRVISGRTKITERDLEKLTYLKMVIKETLRLHPPAPLLLRECKETCLVLGYKVPAGTRVLINGYGLGRDERYWVDALDFRPERFADGSLDYKGNNFEYLPFGSGRRICPGMNFGNASIEVALAHLLNYFDWKLPKGMKAEDVDMREIAGIATLRHSPLFMLATPAVPLP